MEHLALARRIRLFRGTSFGFNDTRVTLVPGVTGQIRLACGMEHAATTQRLAQLVQHAVDVVDDPEICAFCRRLNRFFPDYPRVNIPRRAELQRLEQYIQEFDRRVVEATRMKLG